jgi:hypothetical protein
MNLKAPDGVNGINIAAIEYVAVNGEVDITDAEHIAVAMNNGFTLPATTTAPAEKGE